MQTDGHLGGKIHNFIIAMSEWIRQWHLKQKGFQSEFQLLAGTKVVGEGGVSHCVKWRKEIDAYEDVRNCKLKKPNSAPTSKQNNGLM